MQILEKYHNKTVLLALRLLDIHECRHLVHAGRAVPAAVAYAAVLVDKALLVLAQVDDIVIPAERSSTYLAIHQFHPLWHTNTSLTI
jgi:hypothetical protein